MFPHSVIIYDEWLNNKEYRRSISEKMSLLNVEENIFNVHGYGKSLFNTSLKVVNPDDLLKRYEIHKDHKLYKQLVLGDNELKIMWNSTLEMHCTSLKNYVFNKMFVINQ
jgi:flagellar assembly factor FliW